MADHELRDYEYWLNHADVPSVADLLASAAAKERIAKGQAAGRTKEAHANGARERKGTLSQP